MMKCLKDDFSICIFLTNLIGRNLMAFRILEDNFREIGDLKNENDLKKRTTSQFQLVFHFQLQ